MYKGHIVSQTDCFSVVYKVLRMTRGRKLTTDEAFVIQQPKAHPKRFVQAPSLTWSHSNLITVLYSSCLFNHSFVKQIFLAFA